MRKDLDISIVFPKEKDYFISLREALQNCPESERQQYTQKKYNIMKLIPEGCYWRSLPDDIQREYMGASYHLGGEKPVWHVGFRGISQA
jgi:DNA (cytosine-5)-methyltransferase 1